MQDLAKRFAEYCEQQFDLTGGGEYNYQSLSLCVLDCVYSLRTRYFQVTIPTIQRYADAYLEGDPTKSGDTLTMLLERMEDAGGAETFAKDVLCNRQKIGGKHQIPKEQVCQQLAKYLRHLQIDTLEDFRKFESPELLEAVIRAVKGMGDAGVNYLFMLAGDPDRCKPDVHIHHGVVDALGQDLSNEKCQQLFKEAVELLKNTHKDLTVRKLDGIIWNHYQSRQS